MGKALTHSIALVGLGVALGLSSSSRADEPAAGAASPEVTPSATEDAPRAPPGRAPLQLVIDKAKVDLVEHHLELRASRDLAKVTIKVVGDSGAIVADEARELAAHPAGRPLVVRWSPSSEEPIVRMEVFVYDVDGYYKGIAITPWSEKPASRSRG